MCILLNFHCKYIWTRKFIVVSLRNTYLPSACMQHSKKKHYIYTVTFFILQFTSSLISLVIFLMKRSLWPDYRVNYFFPLPDKFWYYGVYFCNTEESFLTINHMMNTEGTRKFSYNLSHDEHRGYNLLWSQMK